MDGLPRLGPREQKDSLSDSQASTSTSASSFVDVKDLVRVGDTAVPTVPSKLSP